MLHHMANKVIMSPLIARISGTMAGPTSALVLRYTGVGKAALISPKSHGGPETKTNIWSFTQWAWTFLDEMWSDLSPADRVLWRHYAHNSKHRGRSGFGYFRSVNIMRLLFWYPPLPRPPNTCNSRKARAVNSEENPGLYPGVTKSVWHTGTMYPKPDNEPFGPEVPTYPLPELPPPDEEEPAPPPAPPYNPCYPPNSFTITALPADDGNIYPAGIITYKLGTQVQYWARPNCAFGTDWFTYDGHIIAPPTYHTFYNVHADHVLEASYSLLSYETARDDFDRDNAPTLGECWYPPPTNTMPCEVKAHYAWSQYDPDLGGLQSSYQNFRKHLYSHDVKMYAIWDGLDNVHGTGRYQSMLILNACRESLTTAGNHVWLTVVADSIPGNSFVAFRIMQWGEITMVQRTPIPDDTAGMWTFYARQTLDNAILLQAFFNDAFVAGIEIGIYDRGSWNRFALRMRPVGGVINWGYTHIDTYFTRVSHWY